MSAALKDKFRNLSDANAHAKETKAGVDIRKRMTTLKGSGDGGGEGGGGEGSGTGAVDTSPMPPTAEQLAKINQFTRSEKTAQDVVAFSTLACNDLYDRDDERFMPDTVSGFADLAGALSPVGKAYMVSHDYTKLPIGRIFDVGTKDISVQNPSGHTMTKTSRFLTAEVYIPNTDANKAFIENLDFGINWAVSVGVMLESAKCSLPWCGAPMYSSRFFGSWCAEGHDKGQYYTADAEVNSWGEAIPCPSTTEGAQKCRTDLVGAKDFYELSQCFLGAQYFAALDGQKAVSARNLIKAAGAANVPVLGLSRQETHELLDDSMMDPRVRQAVRQFGAAPDDDGLLTWTDDQKLVWQFDPESGVVCLGSSSEGDESGEAAAEQSAEGTHGASDSEHEQDASQSSADERVGESAEDGRAVGSGSDEEGPREDGSVTAAAGSHSHSHQHADGVIHSHAHSHGSPNDYAHSSSDSVNHTHGHNDDKEATVSKAAVVKALRGLGNVPDAVLRAVEDAEGDALDAALSPLIGKIVAQGDEITALSPKAVLGDQFIEAKRAEAISWYVKANQVDGRGVNTDNFQKLLETCGDNIALLDELINSNKSVAQAKFPSAVRRSSFPTDPNNPQRESADEDDGDDVGSGSNTVTRIHG